jgi:hypothetical protein
MNTDVSITRIIKNKEKAPYDCNISITQTRNYVKPIKIGNMNTDVSPEVLNN